MAKEIDSGEGSNPDKAVSIYQDIYDMDLDANTTNRFVTIRIGVAKLAADAEKSQEGEDKFNKIFALANALAWEASEDYYDYLAQKNKNKSQLQQTA